MSDLVPAWANAIAAAAQVYLGIVGNRRKAAEEFGRLLDELLDLPAAEIEARLGRAKIAELVGDAWEAAARTSSEQKRWVFARIAVAGLRGETDDAQVDPLPLLLRTVEALDPPHIQLLVRLGTSRPGTGQLAGSFLSGFWRIEELEEALPSAGRLVRPMLAALVREGLIEDRAVGTWNHQPAYSLTDYGRDFLHFLPAQDVPGMERAALLAVRTATTEILIRNVGLAGARSVHVEGPHDDQGQTLLMNGEPPPFDLAPGDDIEFGVRPPNDAYPAPVVTLRWTDGAGQHQIEVSVAL